MRIVQIITRGNLLAGAQTHVIGLSIELKKRGHEVLFCVGILEKYKKD